MIFMTPLPKHQVAFHLTQSSQNAQLAAFAKKILTSAIVAVKDSSNREIIKLWVACQMNIVKEMSQIVSVVSYMFKTSLECADNQSFMDKYTGCRCSYGFNDEFICKGEPVFGCGNACNMCNEETNECDFDSCMNVKNAFYTQMDNCECEKFFNAQYDSETGEVSCILRLPSLKEMCYDEFLETLSYKEMVCGDVEECELGAYSILQDTQIIRCQDGCIFDFNVVSTESGLCLPRSHCENDETLRVDESNFCSM
jgi:hypothetical protein